MKTESLTEKQEKRRERDNTPAGQHDLGKRGRHDKDDAQAVNKKLR